MDGKVDVEITAEGGAAVAAFKSSCMCDVEGISAAGRRVREYVEENHPRRLVFDFSEVKFFSSQVLGLLLDTRAKVAESGGEVVISGINPQLHRVFKITNLDKIFQFFDDKQGAVETANTN
ncbi:MAG: STAS domain-containing protein [Sedimentisphaerales bacterium]|nr:STAS domain-containing protein [Sedimentisphaerales bacterium]